MMKSLEELLEQNAWPAESRVKGGFKPRLATIGRLLFSHRLEIGLGVTAMVAPFVRPTIATTRSGLGVKAGGLGLVLAGLALRMWAAGFAGRHTRSEQIEGSKLATTGPYAHLRNPIYLGSAFLGFGMVLLIGDRRLLTPCALTLLALYFGLIPAEEEFLSEKFRDEYETYCRHVPRMLPRLRGWAKAGATKTPFDWNAASGEWRLSLILGAIWGTFRIIASLRKQKEDRPRISSTPPAMNRAGVLTSF
jgi:protein-S-isoprenylcysteine O-methyltransferase Ste14